MQTQLDQFVRCKRDAFMATSMTQWKTQPKRNATSLSVFTYVISNHVVIKVHFIIKGPWVDESPECIANVVVNEIISPSE